MLINLKTTQNRVRQLLGSLAAKHVLLIITVLAGTLVFWIIWKTYAAKNLGFSAKTLWDWMELLVVPAIFLLIGAGFTYTQKQTEQSIAKKSRELDRNIALERQQQQILENYINSMTGLLLNSGLGQENAQQSVTSLASALTVNAIIELEPKRNKQIIHFLFHAFLLTSGQGTHLLRGVDLSGVNLSGVNMYYADLFNSNLSGANLNRANLTGVNMCDANLTGASLIGATVSVAELCGANLSGANLNEAYLWKADMRRTNLFGANLNKASLEETFLFGADLSEADLSKTTLTKAVLDESILIKTNLSGASLNRTTLNGAILSEVDLNGADLSEADMNGAIFNEAVLNESTLTEIDLRRQRLGSVVVGEWPEIILTGTNLSEKKQLLKARSLKCAIMPNGQKYEEWILKYNEEK